MEVSEYDTGTWFGDANTLPDGSFTLDGLPPGNYRVWVNTSGTPYATNFGTTTPVTVAIGGNTSGIDFALETGGSISGTVTSSLTSVTLPNIWVNAVDYQTGEWRGNAQTQADGTYTISALPSGIYKVNVDTSGTDFAFEFYGDTSDFNAAKRIEVTSSGSASNIDIALEGNFRLDPSIMNVRDWDETSGEYVMRTYVEVGIADFQGTLPGDIDTVTVIGPAGFTLTMNGNNFQPQWNTFFAMIDGSPSLGVYTFTVASGDAGRTVTDYQYNLRTLPSVDQTRSSPADGSVVSSKTPIFTWPLVDYTENIALYYRLEIDEDSGRRKLPACICHRPHQGLVIFHSTVERARSEQDLPLARPC